MRPLPAAIGLLLTAAVVGCASTGDPDQRRGTGDIITQEELATVQASNALEAIQRLRPTFLRQRGTTTVRGAGPEGQPTGINAGTGTEIVVYVDGVRAGGVEVLRNLNLDSVTEVRRISASDATTLYGTGHAGGVIQVKTRQ